MALTGEDKNYIQTTVNEAIERLAITINDSFQVMHQRLDVIEIRIGNLEKRMSKTEARLGEIDTRLSHKVDLLFDAVSYRTDDAAITGR